MAKASSKADLGSLSTFLLNPSAAKAPSSTAGAAHQLPTKRAGATVGTAAADAAFPPRPQRDPFKDGTLLNRKVAFKMLKQLGCQVRQRPSEEDGGDGNDAGNAPEAVIEVRLQEQPILFQMLLEFGYEPRPDTDGVPSICVEQPRQRARDEVFAALAAPKPAKAPPAAEVTLTPPRPRMTAQEKAEMVKRLSERRTAKAPTPAEEEQAPRQESRFRSRSEQKAHLERLLRPRDYRPSSNEEPPFDHPPPRSASMGAPLGTWPPASSERRVEASPSASTLFSRSRASRPSALAQVGYMSLSTPGSGSSSRHSASAYSASPSSEGQTVAPRQEAFPSEVPETSSEVERSSEGNAERAAAAVAEADHHNQVSAGSSSTEKGLMQLTELDSVLGPLQQWPGRIRNTRSRAEQQKRLENLAKPRPVKEQQEAEAVAAPKRSLQEQREACSRLAAPRPAAQAKQETTSEAADPSKDEAAGILTGQDEVPDELASNVDPEDPQVVVIPSMLSQLSHGLDRIEEDAPAASVDGSRHGGPGRRRQRASSVPAAGAAAPYATPLFPTSGLANSSSSSSSARRPPRGRSVHRRDAPADITSSSLHELMVEDPEWAFTVIRDELGDRGGVEGEEMLADIDKLYNALLLKSAAGAEAAPVRGRVQRGRAEGRGAMDLLIAGREAAEVTLKPHSKVLVDDSEPSAHGKEARKSPSEGGQREGGQRRGEDEALLDDIDQLYKNLLQDGASSSCASTAEMPTASANEMAPDKGEATGCADPDTTSQEERALGELLTEVLWSALMLRRSLDGGVDVQSSLLEILPPPDLAHCFLICGNDGLTPGLMQRLGAELPAVLTALVCSTPDFGGPQGGVSGLLAKVREARDNLLTLASTKPKQDEAPEPPPASTKDISTESSRLPPKPKLKVRKTSLSHWTSECLENLDAPPKRLTQRLIK